MSDQHTYIGVVYPNRVTTSFTSVGHEADSPAPLLRPSPATCSQRKETLRSCEDFSAQLLRSFLQIGLAPPLGPG
jgi:hypothetical protein